MNDRCCQCSVSHFRPRLALTVCFARPIMSNDTVKTRVRRVTRARRIGARFYQVSAATFYATGQRAAAPTGRWETSIAGSVGDLEVRIWGSGAGDADHADLPSGTVIFLFTDNEGSTERWERDRHRLANSLSAEMHFWHNRRAVGTLLFSPAHSHLTLCTQCS